MYSPALVIASVDGSLSLATGWVVLTFCCEGAEVGSVISVVGGEVSAVSAMLRFKFWSVR